MGKCGDGDASHQDGKPRSKSTFQGRKGLPGRNMPQLRYQEQWARSDDQQAEEDKVNTLTKAKTKLEQQVDDVS